MDYFLSVIIGLLAGILSGLVGIGGGSIIVPALFLSGIIGIKKAVGISLAVMIPTAMASLIKHSEDRTMNFKIFPTLCLGALTGGYLGASLSEYLNPLLLAKILGASLILIGLNTTFNITGKIRDWKLRYNLETGDDEAQVSTKNKSEEVILFYEI